MPKNEFSKKIGGENVKVNAVHEITKGIVSWGATRECPWCPKVFHSTRKSTARRAAYTIFDGIEAHWKTTHKK